MKLFFLFFFVFFYFNFLFVNIFVLNANELFINILLDTKHQITSHLDFWNWFKWIGSCYNLRFFFVCVLINRKQKYIYIWTNNTYRFQWSFILINSSVVEINVYFYKTCLRKCYICVRAFIFFFFFLKQFYENIVQFISFCLSRMDFVIFFFWNNYVLMWELPAGWSWLTASRLADDIFSTWT